MSVKQIDVQTAKTRLDAGEGAVYIDVRTPREFEAGHPPDALNIPLLVPNPATGQMSPNVDFLNVVAAHVPKDRKVIVGCQMGGRSQMAAQLLDESGYTDVSNMQGGFGGAHNPMGQLVAPGWLQMQFPIDSNPNAPGGYETLKRAAGR